MLYTWLVGVTAGVTNPNTLIWNGSSRNAPDTPAIDVKNEITNAMSGGSHSGVSTPDTGKRKSNYRDSNRPWKNRSFEGS